MTIAALEAQAADAQKHLEEALSAAALPPEREAEILAYHREVIACHNAALSIIAHGRLPRSDGFQPSATNPTQESL